MPSTILERQRFKSPYPLTVRSPPSHWTVRDISQAAHHCTSIRITFLFECCSQTEEACMSMDDMCSARFRELLDCCRSHFLGSRTSGQRCTNKTHARPYVFPLTLLRCCCCCRLPMAHVSNPPLLFNRV